MANRSYGQFCGLALALDRVGDRWTLLIVRELIAGPARFGELQEGLPGVATNLLTDRLRALEADGLIARRTLDEPAGTNAYELTAVGHELTPALRELMLWGARFMPEADFGAPANPRSWVTGLVAMSNQVPVDGLQASLVVQIDGEDLAVIVDGKEVIYALGQPPSVDATIVMDSAVMMEMARGELDPREALALRDVPVEGDRTAAQVFFELLGRVRDALFATPSSD